MTFRGRDSEEYIEPFPGLSHRASELLRKMRASKSSLYRQYSHDGNGIFIWWLEPGGQFCTRAAAKELAESGYLTEMDDGLFGGFSQSFAIRPDIQDEISRRRQEMAKTPRRG